VIAYFSNKVSFYQFSSCVHFFLVVVSAGICWGGGGSDGFDPLRETADLLRDVEKQYWWSILTVYQSMASWT